MHLKEHIYEVLDSSRIRVLYATESYERLHLGKKVLAKVLKSIRKTGLHWQRVFKKKITGITTKHWDKIKNPRRKERIFAFGKEYHINLAYFTMMTSLLPSTLDCTAQMFVINKYKAQWKKILSQINRRNSVALWK